MQTQFYLSKDGNSIGPFPVEVILKKVESGEHQWTDYCYDELKADWVVLMEHPSFSDKFKEMKPQASSAPPKAKHTADREWFVLRGENKYGPFTFQEVVRMLQARTLYDHDYVWNAKMESWKKISECPDYAPEKIQQLHATVGTIAEEIFFRRRHARVSYGASVIIHNNKKVWKAESLEISVGGAGIVLDDTKFNSGDSLFLHFKPGDGVPPFNAICEIVSVKPVGDTQTRYGVKFTSISHAVQKSIQDFTKRHAA